MNSEEFEQTAKSKGWSTAYIALRWGLKPRRIQQIKQNPNEARGYYRDAVRGLHKLTESPSEDDIKKYSSISAKQLKAVYEKKGWDTTSLAQRWGFAGLSGLYAFFSRNPIIAFDAVHGLPDAKTAEPETVSESTTTLLHAQCEDKGWNINDVAARWGYKSVSGLYGFMRRNPTLAVDAVNGLPHRSEIEIH